jgi:phosphatidylserine decarboxylase
LFVRRLRAGARRIDPSPDIVVAPSDGVVAAAGQARGGTMIQAKGRGYSLDELVADRRLADRLVDGAYATIYLSPRDYHRVHAPIDAHVVRYHYVPGALWPVNPRVAARRDRLLARNERVVIELDADGVAVAVVMVGASGVGNIDLAHGPRPTQSAAWRASAEPRTMELDQPVRRGDELAAFRLGSTVVLVLAPRTGGFTVAADQVVRVGERIGRFAPEGRA